MAAAPSFVARLRSHSIRLDPTRHLTTSIRSLSTASNTNAGISDSNATSNVAASPPTPEWQQRVQTLWEQASGDAELRLLKNRVSQTSQDFDNAVRLVSQQRRRVEECQKTHETVYQRHASLLMRREQWNPDEAASFVEITSQEVQARQALKDARDELHHMEQRASQLQQTYMDALRTKYQEEQAWQDRWRLLGTYGTWSLIGLNSLVFLLSQVLFYKRETRRLLDIETLIQQHLTLPSATVVVAEENVPSLVAKEKKNSIETSQKETIGNNLVAEKSEEVKSQENVVSDIGDDDSSTTTTTQDKNDTDDHPLLVKLKHYKHEVENNLHVPSATAGAVVSASICIVLSLLLSKR